MTEKIILYGSRACSMVAPARSLLRETGASFEEIDIDLDPQAEARVRQINGGNASVPTLVFPDGTTLTEPDETVLRAQLATLGHRVAPARRSVIALNVLAVLARQWPWMLGLCVLAFGALIDSAPLEVAGVLMVLIYGVARVLAMRLLQ